MKRKGKEIGFMAAGVFLLLGTLLWRGETRVCWAQAEKRQYSEIYDREEAVLPSPPEIEDESGKYRLISTEIEEIPVTGRRKRLSGQVVYEEAGREQPVPVTAELEVEDEESGQAFTAELDLERTEYLNERWKGDLSFTVTFHSYGADFYRFGEAKVPHSAEKPQLQDCYGDLLAAAGIAREDCRIEDCVWEGEPYRDEDGILCRDAAVTGMRRVFDCRAVYSGVTDLPDYLRYQVTAEYEKEAIREEAGENAEPLTESAALTPAGPDSAPEKTNGPEPVWLRWLKRGLTVSIGLFLIAAAFLIFWRLWKKAGRLGKGE